MSDNKKNTPGTNPVSEDKDTVTINLQPLLIPFSILLSAIILSTSLLVGLNNVGNNIKNISINTTANTQQSSSQAVTVSMEQIKSVFQGNYIKFGDDSKKVLFVEFSDPSCPYCHIAGGHNAELNKSAGDQFKLVADGGSYVAPVPEIKKLVDQGKASFAWVYLNGHGNGDMGTKALYCAYDKGKFWEVHDLLMSAAGYDLLNNTVKNDKGKSQELVNFLKAAMDPNDLKSCIDSGKYDNRLQEEITLAKNTFGVSGTPGFFVNNTSYPGAYGFTDMKATVDNALNQ